jgi:hypothetical protein
MAGADPMRGLCRACTGALGVGGASLMVIADGSAAPLAWSDAIAGRLEELQLTLGEGPGLDAHASGRSVAEPDLARPRRSRWVALGPAAAGAGAAALFSFPLRVGGVRLGALTLYRDTPGPLTAEQHADAQGVADVAVTGILVIQADTAEGGLGPGLEMLVGHDAALHQAAGMVSAQLGVGVGEALVRLRAHAFVAARPLAEVAADVVSRRMRFDA